MKILIADKFEESGRIGMRTAGCEVSFQPDLKDEALVEAIAKGKTGRAVVRGTKVTEPMLAAGPLKVIVRAGAGYNTIDVAAASRRGIMFPTARGRTR
jgi:D-3-phosphoglycerate dehydrogenase